MSNVKPAGSLGISFEFDFNDKSYQEAVKKLKKNTFKINNSDDAVVKLHYELDDKTNKNSLVSLANKRGAISKNEALKKFLGLNENGIAEGFLSKILDGTDTDEILKRASEIKKLRESILTINKAYEDEIITKQQRDAALGGDLNSIKNLGTATRKHYEDIEKWENKISDIRSKSSLNKDNIKFKENVGLSKIQLNELFEEQKASYGYIDVDDSKKRSSNKSEFKSYLAAGEKIKELIQERKELVSLGEQDEASLRRQVENATQLADCWQLIMSYEQDVRDGKVSALKYDEFEKSKLTTTLNSDYASVFKETLPESLQENFKGLSLVQKDSSFQKYIDDLFLSLNSNFDKNKENIQTKASEKILKNVKKDFSSTFNENNFSQEQLSDLANYFKTYGLALEKIQEATDGYQESTKEFVNSDNAIDDSIKSILSDSDLLIKTIEQVETAYNELLDRLKEDKKLGLKIELEDAEQLAAYKDILRENGYGAQKIRKAEYGDIIDSAAKDNTNLRGGADESYSVEKIEASSKEYSDALKQSMQTATQFVETNNQVSSSIQTTGEVIDSSAERIKELESALDSEKNATAELLEENKKLSDSNKKLEGTSQELEEIKQKYTNISQEIKNLQTELDNSVSMESLTEAKDEIESVKQKLADAKEKLDDLNSSYSSEVSENKELRDTIRELREDYSSLNNDLAQTEKQLNKVRDKNEFLSEEFDRVNDELKENKEALSGTRQELELAERDYNSLVDIIDMLEGKITDLEKVEKQSGKKDTLISNLKTQVSDYKKELSTLSKDNSSLTKQNKEFNLLAEKIEAAKKNLLEYEKVLVDTKSSTAKKSVTPKKGTKGDAANAEKDLSSELELLDKFYQKLNEVKTAINQKTEALKLEAQVAEESVGSEITIFTTLLANIERVQEAILNIGVASETSKGAVAEDINSLTGEVQKVLKTLDPLYAKLGSNKNGVDVRIRVDASELEKVVSTIESLSNKVVKIQGQPADNNSKNKSNNNSKDNKKASGPDVRVEKSIDNFNRLIAVSKRYYALINQKKSGKALTDGQKKELSALEVEYNSLIKKLSRYIEQSKLLDIWQIKNIEDAKNLSSSQKSQVRDILKTSDAVLKLALSFDQLHKKQQAYELKTSLKETNQPLKDKLKQEFNTSKRHKAGELTNLEKSSPVTIIKDGQKVTADFSLEVIKLKGDFEELGKAINKLDPESENFKSDLEALSKELDELKEKKKSLLIDSSNVHDPNKAAQIQARISDYLEKNSRLATDAKNRLKELLAACSTANVSGLKEIDEEFNRIKTSASAAGQTGKNFIDKVKTQLRNLGSYLASYVSVFTIFNEVKQGLEIFKDFDSALAEMKKVSSQSVETIREYQKASFDLADAVGTTGLNLQKSTEDWLRLGESMDKAAESAQVANVLLNTSEFESIDGATTALVALSKAYDEYEDNKMAFADKLNNVADNEAISVDGLARAAQASASALKTAGSNIDETLALITAGNESTQDPDKTGNGMRTIALRLTGTEQASKELEEMGETTDDMIKTQSKLRDTIMSATKVASNGYKGVDLLDENGNYKSPYKVLKDIADVYEEIVETDKKTGNNNVNLLLETIAGKNRANIAASILQHPETLEKAYNEAINAAGTAERENEAFLESIEGHLQNLQNKWQEIWANATTRDFVNGIIDIGTGLLDIISKLGIVQSLIIGIGAYLSGKKLIEHFLSDNLKSTIQSKAETVDNLVKKEAIGINEGLAASEAMLAESKTVATEASKSEATVQTVENAEKLQGAAANTAEAVTEAGETVANNNPLDIFISKLKNVPNILKSIGNSIKAVFTGAFGPLAIFATTVFGTIAVVKTVQTAFNKYYENIRSGAEEVRKAYQKANSEISAHKETLDNIGEEYVSLSKGVSAHNDNISLSNEDYERYLELNKEIAKAFPALISGYDSEGNAIINCKNNLKALNDELERQQDNQYREILADSSTFAKNYYTEANEKENWDISAQEKINAINALQDLDYEAYINSTKAYGSNTYHDKMANMSNQEFQYLKELQKEFNLSIEDDESLTRFKEKAMSKMSEIQSVYNTALSDLHTLANANLNLDDKYKNLDDESKQLASTLANNFDGEFLSTYYDTSNAEKTEQSVYDYTNDILESVSKIAKDSNLQDEIAGMFEYSFDNKSMKQIFKDFQKYQNDLVNAGLSKEQYSILEKSLGLDEIENTKERFNNSLSMIANSGHDISKLAVSTDVYNSELAELKEYTKDFTTEQAEAWISANINCSNATEAIENYEEALRVAAGSMDINVISIAAEKEAITNVTSAISEMGTATGLSTDAITTLTNHFDQLDGYNPAKLFINTATGVSINTTELAKLNKEYEAQNRLELAKKQKELQDAFDKTKQKIDECTNASDRADYENQLLGISKKIVALEQLTAQYEGLTSAYNDFVNSANIEDSGSKYDSVESMLDSFVDNLNEGKWGDATVKTGIDFFAYGDQSTASIKELQNAWEDLQNTIGNTDLTVFDFFIKDDNQTSVDNFLKAVNDINSSWASLNDNGEWEFNFPSEEEVAAGLGVGVDVVDILIGKMQELGYEVDFEGSEALQTFEELQNKLIDNAEEISKLNELLKEAGATTIEVSVPDDEIDKQIEGIKKDIANAGELGLDDSQVELLSTQLSRLAVQKAELDDPIYMNLDTADFEGELSNVLFDLQQYQELQNQIAAGDILGTNTDDLTEIADSQLTALIARIQGLDEETKIKIGLVGEDGKTLDDSVDNIKAKINDLDFSSILKENTKNQLEYVVSCAVDEKQKKEAESLLETINSFDDVNINVKTKVSGLEAIKTLATALQDIVNKDSSVTLDVNTEEKGTGKKGEKGKSRRRAFADGTGASLKDGLSLGGELGPELVVRDGEYFTIGDNSAEMFEYRKGDIIFDAEQTKQILKNGKISSGVKRGQAFAGGNVKGDSNNHKSNVNKLLPNYGNSDKKSKSGKSSKSGDSSSKDNDNSLDWIEVKLKRIEREITNLGNVAEDTFITLQERNEALGNEISKTTDEMEIQKSAMEKYLELANGVGLSESYAKKVREGDLSAEDITDENLKKKIDKYQDFYEKALACQDKVIELKKNLSTLAKNQFDNLDEYYNAITSLNTAVQQYRQTIHEANTASYKAPMAANYIRRYYDEANNTLQRNITTSQEQVNALQTQLASMLAKGLIQYGSTEWYNMNNSIQSCVNNVAEYAKQIENNLAQKSKDVLDGIANRYDRMVSSLQSMQQLQQTLFDVKNSSYRRMIDGYSLESYYSTLNSSLEKQANTSIQKAKELRDELMSAMRNGYIQAGSQDWNQMEQNIQSATTAAAEYAAQIEKNKAELAKTKFENIRTEYTRTIERFSKTTSTLNSLMDLAETQGCKATANYYEKLANVQRQNINSLNKEYTDLKRSLEEALNAGRIEKGSADWYEMANAVYEVNDALIEAQKSLAEYNKEMRQVSWDRFDSVREMVSGLSDEVSWISDIIESDNLVLNDKDTGDLNQFGNAIGGLHAINYNTDMNQADQYAKAIREITEELKANPYDKDLIARREALLKAQRDSISAAQSEKKSIHDLIKNTYDAQLNALQKLIDKRKELLNTEKTQHDYERNIREKTKNISTYQKQLQAYSNDDSEESRAIVQRLNKSLNDAKDDLRETEYDKYLSDQQDMLDGFYNSYQEWMNQRLDDLNLIVSEFINNVNANTESISETISAQMENLGYNMTDNLAVLISNGATGNELVAMYNENFLAMQTAVNENLAMLNAWEEAQYNFNSQKAADDIESQARIMDNISIVGSNNDIGNNSLLSSIANVGSGIINGLSSVGNTVANGANGIIQAIGAWQARVQSEMDAMAARYNSALQNAYNGYLQSISAANVRTGSSSSVSHKSSGSSKSSSSGHSSLISNALKQNSKAINKNASKGTGVPYANYAKKVNYSNIGKGTTFDYLKKHRFAEGGTIGKQIKELGEDGFILARTGEEVLSLDKIEALKNAFKYIQPVAANLSKVSNKPLDIPKRNSDITANNSFEVSFDLPNVSDYGDFVRKARLDPNFEKLVQTITLNSLQGGNTLSKLKIK